MPEHWKKIVYELELPMDEDGADDPCWLWVLKDGRVVFSPSDSYEYHLTDQEIDALHDSLDEVR